MKKRYATLLVTAILAISVVGISPASAEVDDGGIYLALGDSLPAGTQQPEPFTENGYVDALFKDLRDGHGFDRLVNLSCPGEDTVEMRFGIGGASLFGSLCYGPFPPFPPGGTSQLDVAVDYLLTHPGEVELISITIGANDILSCNPTDPPPVLNACLAAQLGQIGTNLPAIVGTLQAAAPGIPIVAMNYYNPNLAFWVTGPAGQELAAQSLLLTSIFNATLESVYGAFGVPVADVATAFKTFQTNGAQVPANVRTICLYTGMCEKEGPAYVLSDYDPVTPGPQTDIHPSNKGHKKIASTFSELIDELGLLD
jgi:lysophospholipase L1-like esterase